MLRAGILSLLLLSLLATGLPLSDSLAYWGERPAISRRSKSKHVRQRHSRAWWRRRRARLRRKRAALRRRQYHFASDRARRSLTPNLVRPSHTPPTTTAA